MGWLARMFGTDPATRVERARKLLEAGEFNDARWELEDLDHPDAAPLREKARQGLVVLNLDEAGARYRAGDFGGAQEHLELAKDFGATSSQLREVRRIGREERARLKAEAEAKAQAELLVPEGDDPLWSLPPDDPRIRYAVLLEAWPDDLRARLAALGPDFAKAVMLIEEGRGAQAASLLDPFVHRDPVARWERARAHQQAGSLAPAASDLATFGEAVGHRRIGQQHTATVHAQVLARLRRFDEALALIDGCIAQGDEDLALKGMRVSLLEALGRLEEAESSAETLLLTASKDQGLYRMLARIRLRLDKRMGATAALEGGLAKTCSNPGKCGNQPFDVHAARMLASLYLEDRREPGRVKELLAELGRNVQEPVWEDQYIAALQARNDGLPGVDRLARLLKDALPEGDPRRRQVHQAFAAQLTG